MEGEAEIEGIRLAERDALEITGQDVTIKALRDTHMVVIEMAKA